MCSNDLQINDHSNTVQNTMYTSNLQSVWKMLNKSYYNPIIDLYAHLFYINRQIFYMKWIAYESSSILNDILISLWTDKYISNPCKRNHTFILILYRSYLFTLTTTTNKEHIRIDLFLIHIKIQILLFSRSWSLHTAQKIKQWSVVPWSEDSSLQVQRWTEHCSFLNITDLIIPWLHTQNAKA